MSCQRASAHLPLQGCKRATDGYVPKDGLKYHILTRHAEHMVDHVEALMEKNVEKAAPTSEKAA